MFSRMSYGRALEALLTSDSLRTGDALVSLHDPSMRGVGVELAEIALDEWYSSLDWREESLTDDDGRRWKFGQLVVHETASLESLHEVLDAADGLLEIHAVTGMNSALVPELRRLVRDTKLGISLNSPFTSQLMRMVQPWASSEHNTASDSYMYETFTMGHGPIVATPEPETVIVASKKVGREARNIGEIVCRPEIRIRSQGIEQRGQILSYDI